MNESERRIHRALARQEDGSPPTRAVIAELVRAEDPLRAAAEVERSVEVIEAQLCGLGPLQPLLARPEVTDILVNGPGPVWIEGAGVVKRSGVELSRDEIDLLVQRILAPLGRRADPVHPTADGRLADGSRVHVVVPPVAVDGPCISIRRFSLRPVPLVAVAEPPVAELLATLVRDRANLVVSGGTGSGKTTLLNALAAHIEPGQRIVTVEEAAELRLASDHVVRLEGRPATSGGPPEVTIRSLVRDALRMRPDRIVVGEVRGGEAWDLLGAMSTGHAGSMSTVHANGAREALDRLESLAMLAGTGVPQSVVARYLADALDVIVHIERTATGTRRVTAVAEVCRRAVPTGDAPRVRVLADHRGLRNERARTIGFAP